ncbi:hypothetical protein B0H14DRAFT_2585854 [Mycena olivaceomarginata]|nr:hypothetical protein B0H14DRAFT_2585854 [Mycena olivaceomarginata]
MATRSQIFRTTPRPPFHRPRAQTHSHIPLNWQILEYAGPRTPFSIPHRQVSGIEKVIKFMQTNKSSKSVQTIQCRFCHLLCLREGERVAQHDKTSLPSFVMTKRHQNLSSPAVLLYRVSVNWLGYTPKEWTGLSLRVVQDNSRFPGQTSKFRAIQPITSKSPRRSPFDPSIEGITSILPESLLYTAFIEHYPPLLICLGELPGPPSINYLILFWLANPLRLASWSYVNEQKGFRIQMLSGWATWNIAT